MAENLINNLWRYFCVKRSERFRHVGKRDWTTSITVFDCGIMINDRRSIGWQRNYSWIQYVWLVLWNSRVKCIQELNRRFRIVLSSTIDRPNGYRGRRFTHDIAFSDVTQKVNDQNDPSFLCQTCAEFIFTPLAFSSDIWPPISLSPWFTFLAGYVRASKWMKHTSRDSDILLEERLSVIGLIKPRVSSITRENCMKFPLVLLYRELSHI